LIVFARRFEFDLSSINDWESDFMRSDRILSSCVALAAICVSFLPAGAFAEDEAQADTAVSFYQQIRPIFQANCHGCHQPAKASGGYVMTDFEKLLKGGESGLAAIVPGKPEDSYLIEQITPDKGEALMPKKADPLVGYDIKLITQWIKAGA